ncbi:hypothetical protein A2U01_0015472 [Trifolium medium]|uniref:Uncharacterized protein n=1 Tax=Trifolium medium TaxID=97028 RepID=A0A392N3W8_9FABA|nr:hypothetical protein [Trifolium medium]
MKFLKNSLRANGISPGAKTHVLKLEATGKFAWGEFIFSWGENVIVLCIRVLSCIHLGQKPCVWGENAGNKVATS